MPLPQVISSAYHDFLFTIHLENLLMVLIFLSIGGLAGYLIYFLLTSLKNKNIQLSLEEILEKGECEKVEFKSSLRWDYRQNKTNKELEHAVLKTIAAFLNTHDGTLMIGVADDASIVGLEKDFQSLKKKNRDGFEQFIMELIALNIGTEICKNIHIIFFKRDGNDICAVHVRQSNIPVYLNSQNNTSFFIRTGNHTRELNIQEAIKYIKQKIQL